jgi:hypothetical protein
MFRLLLLQNKLATLTAVAVQKEKFMSIFKQKSVIMVDFAIKSQKVHLTH